MIHEADALVLLVNHDGFYDLDPDAVATLMPGRTVLDTRGIWDRANWESAGFDFHVLGVGKSET